MFLLDWYHEYLTIKHEHKVNEKEELVCQSCETLKQQLEIANYEKSQLLAKLMKEPTPIKEVEPPEVTKPKNIPWNLRRQLLEREDRERARLMRDAPKPDTEIIKSKEVEETKQFEQELAEATTARENQVK